MRTESPSTALKILPIVKTQEAEPSPRDQLGPVKHINRLAIATVLELARQPNVPGKFVPEVLQFVNSPPNDLRRTLAFAATAIEKIMALNLPADPQSFELWYTYAAGSHPKLNDEIDSLIRTQAGPTESDLNHLYATYLSSTRSANDLNTVASKLSSEVSQVMGMIDTAATSAQDYGNNLVDGAFKFDGLDGTGEFGPILTALIGATNKMVRENCMLKEQLVVSKSRTEKLEHEIELIRVESHTDPVTLAGNRQHFDDSLAKAVVEANKNGAPLTLLLVDIDHFKAINDEYGHQAGDDILRMVAARIKSTLRDDDIVARYGGDEFGIILNDKPIAFAKLVAERVRKAVASSAFRIRSAPTLMGPITVSIGVAELSRGATSARLLEQADKTLYAAKKAGRNVVVSQADVEANERLEAVAS